MNAPGGGIISRMKRPFQRMYRKFFVPPTVEDAYLRRERLSKAYVVLAGIMFVYSFWMFHFKNPRLMEIKRDSEFPVGVYQGDFMRKPREQHKKEDSDEK